MQYWLHRIAYLQDVSYPLLEKGYLSIGFSDFADEDIIEKISEKDWDYFENVFDEIWGNRPRSRYSLWRFVAEMDKGDWVIVPSWGTFSIYEIEEPCAILPSEMILDDSFYAWDGRKILFDKSKSLILEGEKKYLDIGFLRKIKLLAKDISRYDYADAALTSRMKVRNTNANISDLEDSIKKAYNSYKVNKPLNLKSLLYEISIEHWLKAILSELNETKFEALVKSYFSKAGATEVYIPNKNEPDKSGDVDVVATFEPIKTIINVQVKYHRDQTSDWAIQQIKDFAETKEGMGDGYCRQYWVISSSDSFTNEGIKLAVKNNVLLIDGRQFVQMLMDVGIQSINEL